MVPQEFKDKIQLVLDGKEKEVTSGTLISPHHVDAYLESLGFNNLSFDTNGLDCDFWSTYNYKDRKIVMAGSLWINDGITIYEEFL